ncbi:MAG: hypothetical protein ACRC2K_05355 [Clostridium sp.]
MARELNLLPRTYETVKSQNKKTNSIVILALVLALSVGGSFGFVTVREMLLDRQKQALQDELNQSMALIQKDQDLQNQINLTKQHIDKVKSLEIIKQIDTDKILSDFMAYFLNGTFKLKSVNYDMKTLKVDGVSSDKVAIQKVFASLRESNQFNKCHLDGYSSGEGGYAFTIEVTLSGGDKK